MNIKIQGGGGGNYANSGSCYGVVSYLEHEDYKRQENGVEVEPFFNQKKDVSRKEVITGIDNNKAKLCRDDAKFFVITISPSRDEVKQMGNTPREQSESFKDLIRNDIMQLYAEGFGKGLNKEDILYYGKIHHERGDKGEDQMHAHIIVSRKDMSNSKKISPQTNHKTKGKKSGAVKSGFNRNDFYKNIEKAFDQRFHYERDVKKSFEYCNAMKNGTMEERRKQIEKFVNQEIDKSKEKTKEQKHQQERKQEVKRSKGLGL